MTDQNKKPKLLIIEDDVFMIDLIAREFKNAGFEVEIAKTGAGGVQKFEETKPDMILLDILLPDQSGLETLLQIRRKPNGPEAKVMVISNVSEGEDIEEAKRLGAIDYLVKANFALAEVVERVRAALGL